MLVHVRSISPSALRLPIALFALVTLGSLNAALTADDAGCSQNCGQGAPAGTETRACSSGETGCHITICEEPFEGAGSECDSTSTWVSNCVLGEGYPSCNEDPTPEL